MITFDEVQDARNTGMLFEGLANDFGKSPLVGDAPKRIVRLAKKMNRAALPGEAKQYLHAMATETLQGFGPLAEAVLIRLAERNALPWEEFTALVRIKFAPPTVVSALEFGIIFGKLVQQLANTPKKG